MPCRVGVKIVIPARPRQTAMHHPLDPDRLNALAERVKAWLPQEGSVASPLSDVVFMRVDRDRGPTTVFEEPSIVLAFQGVKRGLLGDEVLTYGAGQGLVVSLPISFRCDTVAPQPERPLLALQVRVDFETVRELVARMVEVGLQAPSPGAARAMAVLTLDASMLDLAERMLTTLSSRLDAAILGPALLRELHYRVLLSPAGGCLRELTTWQGRVGAVHRSIECLRARLSHDWQVADLAKEASLSTSAYHAAFKEVTGQTPMQYLKAVRLHRARQLLTLTQRLASEVAFEVGYQSPSQFSRDYKRWFGISPSQARAA